MAKYVCLSSLRASREYSLHDAGRRSSSGGKADSTGAARDGRRGSGSERAGNKGDASVPAEHPRVPNFAFERLPGGCQDLVDLKLDVDTVAQFRLDSRTPDMVSWIMQGSGGL
jgi:hypothetical protein